VVESGGDASVEYWNDEGCVPIDTSMLKSGEIKNEGLEVKEILPEAFFI